ncbi:MAG: outer membrane lipoprotein LolB [Polaromonas sp.]|nr:MAG: outer membrane lipoprotein LolB [Polaromonas sp.]
MRALNRPSDAPDRRSAALGLLLVATFLIAGCAHTTSRSNINDAEKKLWTGRISLQTQSDPPQAFFAGFELNGNPARGELLLTSPIGNVLGLMRWSPDQAVLESGNEVKRFSSVDALLAQTTGAAIPVAALFDWLKGVNTRLSGWSADLSRLALGRIVATRDAPAPPAQLRIVLDQ